MHRLEVGPASSPVSPASLTELSISAAVLLLLPSNRLPLHVCRTEGSCRASRSARSSATAVGEHLPQGSIAITVQQHSTPCDSTLPLIGPGESWCNREIRV